MTGDGHGGRLVRPCDMNLDVQTARTQHRGIDHVDAVRGADHHHVVKALHAVELGEELRHDCRLHIAGDARASGAQQRIHLVDEHDDGASGTRQLLRPLEDSADEALRLAYELVEQLRSLHRQEHAVVTTARGQLMRDGLGYERLAIARRPIQ